MRAGRSRTTISSGVAVGGFAGSGFEEVADDGFVGVEADAGVLEVDDDGVEVFEVFGLRALVGVLGAVEAGDFEAGGGVDLLADVGRVLGAEDAVLGGEEADEFDAGAGGAQDVDGAAALRVEAGLVGEQADAEVASMLGGEAFEGGEVGGFEDVDAGEGVGGLDAGCARAGRSCFQE